LDIGVTGKLDIGTGLMDIKTIVSTGNAVSCRDSNAIGSSSGMLIDGSNEGFGSTVNHLELAPPF
jgi:hypothetical protein